ncbi:MAG: universal stress protein [Vicinamibacterales bacterium]
MSGSTAHACQWPPKTILVAVDFGEASERALALAGVVASAFGSTLRAVHAERFEPPPYFTMEQIERLEADRQAAQAAAVEHLAEFAARAGASPVESVVLDQPPVEAVLDAAAGADLIVMGTHGRRGPGRWWLGSVAERVVRAASVPVLVTRASVAPAREVFGRIALVSEGRDGRVGRRCAEGLARIAGGVIVEGGTIAKCETEAVQQASLVVLARASDGSSWPLADPASRMLTACEVPVLFVPV